MREEGEREEGGERRGYIMHELTLVYASCCREGLSALTMTV